MRGPGQIAELTAIAEPDVGVIVNVGPVHLELLGSLEAIAAAKAELIAGLAPGRDRDRARRRAAARRRTCATTCARSPSARAATCRSLERRARRARCAIARRRASAIVLRPSFAQAHNLRNLLAAVAAARALGVTPGGDAARCASRRCAASASSWPSGVVLIDDCYNANPMSMRAALDDLARDRARRGAWRCSATCSSSGPTGARLHREIGAPRAPRAASSCSSRSGRWRPRWRAAFAGEVARAWRTPRAAAELLPALLARRRHGAREGLARRRPRARRRGAARARAAACERPCAGAGARAALNGAHPVRRHRRAAHLHLPEPQVHRVPARARVRPAHPRGRPRGPPPEGRHADDGRHHRVPRGRRSRS